jgi:serine/threonine-protein kinase HipA
MQESEISNDAVHAYFDNLLPDADAVRKHMKDRLGAESDKPFDLLTKVGKDCVGALTFTTEPATGEMPSLSLSPLSEGEVAQVIRDTRFEKMLGMNSDDDFILHHKSMGIDLSSSVDNEWFCQAFMQQLGMNVANCEIAQFEDQKVLIVERFDRRMDKYNIIRLPQEDICQALGKVSGSKYEDKGGPSSQQVMALLSGSRNAYKDRIEFLKVQIVFWLLAAIDGHGKNFSIALNQDGYRLSPFYDVLSAYPYFGQGNIQPQKIKMAMKVHSKNKHYNWHNIQARHWPEHGKKQGINEAQTRTILAFLEANVESALNGTLKKANELFDVTIGQVITEHTLTCLKKITNFLKA